MVQGSDRTIFVVMGAFAAASVVLLVVLAFTTG